MGGQSRSRQGHVDPLSPTGPDHGERRYAACWSAPRRRLDGDLTARAEFRLVPSWSKSCQSISPCCCSLSSSPGLRVTTAHRSCSPSHALPLGHLVRCSWTPRMTVGPGG